MPQPIDVCACTNTTVTEVYHPIHTHVLYTLPAGCPPVCWSGVHRLSSATGKFIFL